MKRHRIAYLILPLLVAGCLSGSTGQQPAPAPEAAPETASPPEAAQTNSPDIVFAAPTTNYPSIMREAYAQVKLSDGIDDAEAAVLAEAYFMGYITGCGMIGDVTNRGDLWVVQTTIDYARTPYDPVVIDKKTARITCGDGPVVVPPP